MNKMSMDKSNPLPLGIQVKEKIKMMIGSDLYREGDRLPPISKMAESFDVNKNTISAALKSLEKEGLIESKKGKGIFVGSKMVNSSFNDELTRRVENLIQDAKKREVSLNELISFISVKYSEGPVRKRIRALVLVGFNLQILHLNVQKLKDNLPGIEFDGFLLDKNMDRNLFQQAVQSSDLMIIPDFFFEAVKEFIPEGKQVIKTAANIKELKRLKKGTGKKSKIAVIGSTREGAKALAAMFISRGLFRSRLVISAEEIEESKKYLRDTDSFVICLSARNSIDTLKIKGKEVYFFYDYIDEHSIDEVRQQCKNMIQSV